jgi:hypothetical protein
MTETSRAAWLDTENILQKLHEQAEELGDTDAMRKIYAQIAAHHNTQSLGDLIGAAVDRFCR